MISKTNFYFSLKKTTTKSEDVMEKISTFFDTEGLPWNKLCRICTNGVPAMLGSRSGFQTKLKAKSLQAKGFHCVIHRYAPACCHRLCLGILRDQLIKVTRIPANKAVSNFILFRLKK